MREPELPPSPPRPPAASALAQRLDAIEGPLRLLVQAWRGGATVGVGAQALLFEELLALSELLQAHGAPPQRTSEPP